MQGIDALILKLNSVTTGLNDLLGPQGPQLGDPGLGGPMGIPGLGQSGPVPPSIYGGGAGTPFGGTSGQTPSYGGVASNHRAGLQPNGSGGVGGPVPNEAWGSTSPITAGPTAQDNAWGSTSPAYGGAGSRTGASNDAWG